MTQWLIRLFVKDSANTGSASVRSAYADLACITGIVCNVLLFAGKFACRHAVWQRGHRGGRHEQPVRRQLQHRQPGRVPARRAAGR